MLSGGWLVRINRIAGPIASSRPNAPLVQVKERRRTVHYPIELLEVADAQRIRMSQADPMLVRNTTRVCHENRDLSWARMNVMI